MGIYIREGSPVQRRRPDDYQGVKQAGRGEEEEGHSLLVLASPYLQKSEDCGFL